MDSLLDAFVGIASLWAFFRVKHSGLASHAWRVGFAILAFTASVGTLRYAGVTALAHAHSTLSLVATFVGMPLLLLGLFAQPGFRRADRSRLLAVGFAVTGLALAIFAALVVGDVGSWRGIPREQGFHFVFALALFSLGRSFSLAHGANESPRR